MGRIRMDVRFIKRGKIFYYRLLGWKNFKTTGETNRTQAERYVNVQIRKQGFSKTSDELFIDYAGKFFLWDTCPHISRLLDEGKSITKRYAAIQRLNLETHVFPSSLSYLKLSEIKRSHILDFRKSLIDKGLAPATVNKVMNALKVIFNEAFFRQDIVVNPVTGVGIVKEDKPARNCIFSHDELNKLFPTTYRAVWGNELAYTCFFLVACTGMRRSEVLALKWKHVLFEKGYIEIYEAFKDQNTIGKPKWDHERTFPLSSKLKQILLCYYKNSANKMPESLVFCHADGSRLGETWWKKNFDSALRKAGIDIGGRSLTPHKLRHTLGTELEDQGENEEKIKQSMGWRSDRVKGRYIHLQPEQLASEAAIVDAIWNNDKVS
jgi:integrase